jgi:hypothetical protein
MESGHSRSKIPPSSVFSNFSADDNRCAWLFLGEVIHEISIGSMTALTPSAELRMLRTSRVESSLGA